MTPDDLASDMVPVATDLVCLVRDWDRDGIADKLSSLSEHRKDALIVVLAAMVPDDIGTVDLLSWVPQEPDGEMHLAGIGGSVTACYFSWPEAARLRITGVLADVTCRRCRRSRLYRDLTEAQAA